MNGNRHIYSPLIIVGAGISGLRIAQLIKKQIPDYLVLERDPRAGGRVQTQVIELNNDMYQFELGAARFTQKHTQLFKLIRKYGLSRYLTENGKKVTYRWDGEPLYKKTLEAFGITNDVGIGKVITKYIDIYSQTWGKIHRTTVYDIIERCTKEGYLNTTQAKFLQYAYPYDSIYTYANAVLSRKLIYGQYSNVYYSLSCGLNKLISEMLQRIDTSKIRYGVELVTVNHRDNLYTLTCDTDMGTVTYITPNVVLALPPNSIDRLKKTGNHGIPSNLSDVISSTPLYRVYAIYPIDKDTGYAWFNNITRTVSNGPLRYIIPINAKTGLIMISYLDGVLADCLQKINLRGDLQSTISEYVKIEFPEIDIPEPIWIGGKYWESGVHYFNPGIEPGKLQKYLVNPNKRSLWIAGESYRIQSFWIESALNSAKCVAKSILSRNIRDVQYSQPDKFIPTEIPDHLPEYTLLDVSRHHTIDDAWIAIDGYVYDVTQWIPLHPGGIRIMNGVGKDWSRGFKRITSHRRNKTKIKQLMSKYIIGRLNHL